MKLYSTLDRKIVDIQPQKDNTFSIYSCGPTVYYKMHLGNIRAYVDWDVMHRAMIYLGYGVHRVMNFTDVGHMTSKDDFGSDFGEDKVDKESKAEGIEPIDVSNKYINTVLNDFRRLNILAPDGKEIPEDLDFKNVEEYGWMRATNHVNEMVELIKKMEANGYTYETDQAVYFDVTKIPDYTIFTGQKLDEKVVGDRDEVVVDSEKRNPADFVLWMKRTGKYADHIMHWSSPWGDGFPGWHIECSAMGTKALGETFDIHTGGVDHIPVHHTNERAQNIGAFKQPVVRYWVHNEWLVSRDDSKISKSKGNADTLDDTVEQGFDPLDVRYLFMSINYRTKLQFSMEALEGARNARLNIVKKVSELGNTKGNILEEYKEKFSNALENNLNMSEALAILNDLLKSNERKEDILSTVLDFDRVFGLNLEKSEDLFREENINADEHVLNLLEQRKQAREEKNFGESDRLRDEISKMGYDVLDTPEGQQLKKK